MTQLDVSWFSSSLKKGSTTPEADPLSFPNLFPPVGLTKVQPTGAASKLQPGRCSTSRSCTVYNLFCHAQWKANDWMLSFRMGSQLLTLQSKQRRTKNHVTAGIFMEPHSVRHQFSHLVRSIQSLTRGLLRVGSNQLA